MNITKLINSIKSLPQRIAGKAMTLAVMASAAAMVSCDNDEYVYYQDYPPHRPNAMVTVRPETGGGGTFHMQLDDSTSLKALNMKSSPYGDKEVRAFVNFKMMAQQNDADKRVFDVYVNWIDSVLTKPMAESFDNNAIVYGEDPVEIMRGWTVVEDGYFTIHFRTRWGAGDEPHRVNLVADNPQNPYELTFHHDAPSGADGYWGDAVVAFRLDKLPDTKGKYVDLKIKWTSFSGKKDVTFKYCTRKPAANIEGLSMTQDSGNDLHKRLE